MQQEIWVYSIKHDQTSRSAFPREAFVRALAEEDVREFIYYFKEV